MDFMSLPAMSQGSTFKFNLVTVPQEMGWGDSQITWKQNSHTPTGVVGNEPFQIAARLTDSLDNTVNLSLPVQVRAHGKNEFGHEDANLLTGATSVVSKQGIAEFQLSFTGKAGAYYL